MVNTKTGIALPPVAPIVPKGEDRLIRVHRPQRIGPPLLQEARVSGSGPRLEQGIVEPGLRGVDVCIRRHDVVVADKRDRMSGFHELCRVDDEPLEPCQLVVELRARPRIAIWQIKRRHQNAIDGTLHVPSLAVTGVARQKPSHWKGSAPRARSATPFQAFWPTTRLPYPTDSSSARGNCSLMTFSSCRATTSGAVAFNQVNSSGSRVRTLLMFQVAIRMDTGYRREPYRRGLHGRLW